MNDRLKALADAGVSIWLDDLSRERLETGNLADLVKNSHVVGVTSNPAIFQTALADGERWEALEAQGARKQRPLWASTGVKNPDYDDTMYVVDLVVEDTVNTMPEKTLDAVADHGEVRGDRVRPFYDDAAAHMQALADAGIDYDDVIKVLIKEGVDKFVVAWDELQTTLAASLEAARA